MIICAYAKINISLAVLGKRADGYHELKSHMQALPDLYDVLEIVESPQTEITCSNPALSCGDDNLVAGALKLLGKTARVHIDKRIPIAAGLAGGSADAAAVLFAFEGASKHAFDLAAQLGSDVPFSLMAIKHHGKCAAIARGRGEILEPIEPMSGKIITITPEGCAVSTPAVYKEWDREPSHTDGGNDLQAPAIRICPQIQDTLNFLAAPHEVYGAPIIVRQSGSGPTCFAIYK